MANGNVLVTVTRPEDLDLDDALWVNYAYREAGAVAGQLQRHFPANRFITANRVNPLRDNQTALVRCMVGIL